ncbi:MAG: radical SAM protein [Clostridia bacterium]|nr:radical SAM protein [Clostridia bacterium]
MNLRALKYRATKLRSVVHTTLNPEGPGVVRIHLVPPKFSLKAADYVVILNGQDIIPISPSWAIILAEFCGVLNNYDGKELTKEDLKSVARHTIDNVRKIYPRQPVEKLQEDLKTIIEALCDIAYGKVPKVKIGYRTLGEYAPYMAAPHRIDLMISSMTKTVGGVKRHNCNQKCVHCYACGQELAEVDELPTAKWKEIIDKCKKVGIPQLTFTGGEPTMRDDLVELVKYAKWFVTRLNTNGVRMTESLCKALYDASLDSVQITFYSHDADVHNKLVGVKRFDDTVNGIKNALEAGLNVSINTPLCTLNRDYVETLKFLKSLGITYVTCSGMIVTGNATTEESKNTQLTGDELYAILQEATKFCNENKMQISFTSPGWVDEERLRELGLMVPSCGACLSNMAITPDGKVTRCQSWLEGETLGDMLNDDWKTIWNSPACKASRNFSAKMDQTCPLKTRNSEDK